MSRFFFVTILFLNFFSMICLDAQARTNINVVIASPPPEVPVTEVMAGPPEGYASCDMLPAGWVDGVWVPSHQVCHYPGPSGVGVWVSGYYGCTAYSPRGICRHWAWYKGHWGPHMRREAFYSRPHVHGFYRHYYH